MNRKNWLVVLLAIALIAAVAARAALLPQNRTIPPQAPTHSPTAAPTQDAPTAAPSDAPAQEAPTAAPSVAPDATETPAVNAYLVVSVQGMMYEPLPLSGEGSFTIKQDENTTNTVHVTPDSVWMEHSTCDNQDCVDQGTVSLANMSTRVLSNMIICLPNQVVLELYTPETLQSTFGIVP